LGLLNTGAKGGEGAPRPRKNSLTKKKGKDKLKRTRQKAHGLVWEEKWKSREKEKKKRENFFPKKSGCCPHTLTQGKSWKGMAKNRKQNPLDKNTGGVGGEMDRRTGGGKAERREKTRPQRHPQIRQKPWPKPPVTGNDSQEGRGTALKCSCSRSPRVYRTKKGRSGSRGTRSCKHQGGEKGGPKKTARFTRGRDYAVKRKRERWQLSGLSMLTPVPINKPVGGVVAGLPPTPTNDDKRGRVANTPVVRTGVLGGKKGLKSKNT